MYQLYRQLKKIANSKIKSYQKKRVLRIGFQQAVIFSNCKKHFDNI